MYRTQNEILTFSTSFKSHFYGFWSFLIYPGIYLFYIFRLCVYKYVLPTEIKQRGVCFLTNTVFCLRVNER